MPARPRTSARRAGAWVVAAAMLGGLASGAQTAVAQTAAAPRSSTASDPAAVPLWATGAPGALGNAPDDRPELTPFLPDAARATGAAMVVFPGGGYTHLAFDKEGTAVARWLNTLGVAAFVVRYRLGPRYHHPTMEQDGLRAIRLVRARAAAWHVDPHRVGVLGFSAGGHMAGTVATRYADPAGVSNATRDTVDRLSARPDLAVLVYPVVTMAPPLAHAGSRTNLLGPNPDAALVRALSLETQVTRETPPTFLVSTTDDAVVPVENSVLYYRALHTAGVPVELHIYETGHHGFGLAPDDPVLSTWQAQCAAWLVRHGFVRAPASSAP